MFDPRNSAPQRSGGSLKSRLLIALGIALVGLIMYFSQIEENPITGERQHVAISPDQEKVLGLESAPKMAAEMGGELQDSDIRTQKVKEIGNRIVNQTIKDKSPWEFNFHLLRDDKTVNAFALPGGQIFITLGLYNRLQNEAELAGVLGHEIGHVIERHTAEQMAKNQLGQWLIVAFATGASDPSQGGPNNAAVIAQVVNQVIQMRYSRKDESEADLWGIKLMEKTGYDPRAMVNVMKVLKAAGGGGSGIEMFQTHPDPDLRIEDINAYLKENPPPKNLEEGKPLPKSDLGSRLRL
ncbi:MAG: M48 family metalloprotease [Parachlamydiaceae bacterium]